MPPRPFRLSLRLALVAVATSTGACEIPFLTTVPDIPPPNEEGCDDAVAATNLAVTDITGTSGSTITLAWLSSADSTYRIEIERAGAAGGFTSIGEVGGLERSYVDAGCSGRDVFCAYRVQVLSNTCQTPATEPLRVYTLPLAPVPQLNAAGGFDVVNGTDVSLAWTDVNANESGYRIDRSDAGTFVRLTTLPANAVAYVDAGRPLDTALAYRVVALRDNVGAPTLEASADIGGTTRPNAPTGVSAVTVSDTAIDVTWTDASAVAPAFAVTLSSAPDFSSDVEVVDVVAGVTVLHAGVGSSALTPDIHYYFRVAAVSPSDASVDVDADAWTTPAAPTLLVATPSYRGIEVSFSTPASDVNLATYHVRPPGGLAVSATGPVSATGETTTQLLDVAFDAGFALDPDSAYEVEVLIGNAGGNSTAAVITTATWPTAPTDAVATTTGPHAIHIGWSDDNDNETGYEVYFCSDVVCDASDAGNWTSIDVVSAPPYELDHTGLDLPPAAAPGDEHTYMIVALGEPPTGAWPIESAAVFSGRTSALPQLAVLGDPILDPATCSIVGYGDATFDPLVAPALSFGGGNVSGADPTQLENGRVTDDLSGLPSPPGAADVALIADLSRAGDNSLTTGAGPFLLAWTVVDSFGGESLVGSSRGTLAFAAGAIARTSIPGSGKLADLRDLGDDGMVGRQVYHPRLEVPPVGACSGCGGRRGSIAAGFAFTCALGIGGQVYCWGSNGKGEGGNNSGTAFLELPVRVCTSATCQDGANNPALLTDVIALAAGGSHACALAADGVWCWGNNIYDQLGDGSGQPQSSFAVRVCAAGVYDPTSGDCTGPAAARFTGAVAIAAGASSTCALLADGHVRCWGTTPGIAPAQPRPTEICTDAPAGVDGNCAVPANALTDVVSLGQGNDHVCAVKEDGHVYCWGANPEGQLGNGAGGVPYQATATEVCLTGTSNNTVTCTSEGLGGVIAVAAGLNHSCALAEDGASVYCWGDNAEGQMGTGQADSGAFLAQPVCAAGNGPSCNGGSQLNGPFTAITAGSFDTCVIDAGGTPLCWGRNQESQLGLGISVPNAPNPGAQCESGGWNPVDRDCVGGSPEDAVAISAGEIHTCILRPDGTAACAGSATLGRLGNGSITADQVRPGQVCSTGVASAGTCSDPFAPAYRACGDYALAP